MMWGYGSDIGWMWLFGPLMMVGIVLLVVLVVWLINGGTRRPATDSTGRLEGKSRGRQILEERFAKGELTAEQFREQIQVLDEGR